MAEYRIEFSLQCRGPDDEDFTEVGFGSSSACGSPNQAVYEVESIIQNRIWETEPGMPDPALTGVSVPGQKTTRMDQ